MKLIHLFAVLYIGFLISAVFIFFIGDEGQNQYEIQIENKMALKKNINKLKDKNKELQQKLNLLGHSREMIQILARELGYYKPDENIISINKDLNINQGYNIGKLIQTSIKKSNRNYILRIISFSLGALLVLFYLHTRLRKKNDNTAKL